MDQLLRRASDGRYRTLADTAAGQAARIQAAEEPRPPRPARRVALAVNPTKKVWRGHGGKSVHYSRAWDGTKKRTCWQALLIIMKLLLEAHKLAKKQLSAISNLQAQEPPHDDQSPGILRTYVHAELHNYADAQSRA